MKKLYGVITAMTTPFTADGAINFPALEQQVDFLIERGVHCLYPCGTTGEMLLMTPEERELVAETVLRRAAGRVTVYIHVGAMTPAETIRLAKHAHRIGADGIGVVTPVFFSVRDRAMIAYYREVARSVPEDFPVYLYAIPQCAANDLTPAVVEAITAECPNVIGIKYSFLDMLRVKDYLTLRGGSLSVVVGLDRMFLPALAMGCDGTVSGCSGPFPEPFVEIYRAFRQGDIAKARAVQTRANEICEIIKSGADMGIFKAVLERRGLPASYMRPPLVDLTPEERDDLFARLAPYLP